MVVGKRVGRRLLEFFLYVYGLILALGMSNVSPGFEVVALNQRRLWLLARSTDSFKGVVLEAGEAINFCYLSLKLWCVHMLYCIDDGVSFLFG